MTTLKKSETLAKLAKAVLKVMKEVKGVEKNMTIGMGNNSYKGVSDYDVKQVFNNAMVNNGLCLLPVEIEASEDISRWEETYNGNAKQKQQVFTSVKAKYMLLHESGEFQEICGYGHGVDSQDKSAGKATTYALKYALLYTFLTPVGRILDADNSHSDTYPNAAKPISKSDEVKAKIRDAYKSYKGADKEAILKDLQAKTKSKKDTIDYLDSILQKLTA